MGKPVIFDIDFSDYEKSESTSVKIPEGDYLARFVDVEMTTVKNENSDNFGAPGYIVTLEIVGGDYNGTKIVDRLWVIQKAKFRLDQFLSAFGVKVEPKKVQVPVQQILNRTLTITLKDGKPFGDNNIVKSEVKKYAPAGNAPAAAAVEPAQDPAHAEVSDEQASTLDASSINL